MAANLVALYSFYGEQSKDLTLGEKRYLRPVPA